MLTNKKSLIAAIAFNYPIPDDAIEKALIDSDIDGDGNYTKVDEKQIDLCAAGLIVGILTGATSMSEGGFSISMSDREALRKTRSFLLLKWGEADIMDTSVPKISDASSFW